MKKVFFIGLLFVGHLIYPIISFAQLVEPPTDNSDFSWMRWVILTLFGALVTAFGVIKKIYDDRLSDKDKEIDGLKKTISDLSSDKDALQKDIMDKVIPAVVSATDLIRSFMNK